MIKVTIWNEYVQEKDQPEIGKVHNGAIHNTLKALVEEEADLCVKHIGTLEMPECGLTEEVLQDTDVLIWWSHIAQDRVPDEIAERVRDHVLRGMGVIFLHSAHLCKPMVRLLGTSCTLRWRDGDYCRLWNICPSHPIAKGIPESIEVGEEEMYGEFFDIPKPDDQVFLGWFRGGEVFRSGCTWTRGRGRIFYFQPGHEMNRSYFNGYVRQIIRNGIRWAAGDQSRAEKPVCLNATEAPESILK